MTNNENSERVTGFNEPLHYILKLGDDYYHQSVNCNSIEDMEEKAKALETKFGPMELVIRVKKKSLVIHSINTVSSGIFDFGKLDSDNVIRTGILFNPPLAKQINKFKAELEKVETIEDVLTDKPVPRFDSEACKTADSFLTDESEPSKFIEIGEINTTKFLNTVSADISVSASNLEVNE
jgi:hypothetical protein